MTIFFPKHYKLLDCLEWLWARKYAPRMMDLFIKKGGWVYIAPIKKHEFSVLVDEKSKRATLC